MSKPYDATLKAMLEASPADWPRLAGLEVGRTEVIDADVSTVTAATDKVLRLSGGLKAIMSLDFQAGPDAALPRRTHGYNALLEERHKQPVHSLVVLLRPQADLRTITGVYEQRLPGAKEPYLIFRYQVIRVWQLPADQLLAGGPGVLPLAPISAVTEAELPGVIGRMKEKLDTPPYRETAGELWTAVDVLMGLRYDRAVIEQLLRGVRGMKESVTYQAIVEEGVAKGRLEEARHMVLHQGEQRFGQPASASIRSRIEAIRDREVLEGLVGRAFQVGSWDELLADMPAPKPHRGRGKRR
jgi:predicted transposase YdaD